MTLKKITLAALLAAYTCLPLQAMEIDPFKKTGIPTMDQHSTLVKLYAAGIQKFVNSSVGKTVMPWYRQKSIDLLKNNLFYDPSSYFDASPEIQQLGKEAQEKLEIPQEQQVPIKLMAMKVNIAAGYTLPTGIFIGPPSKRARDKLILLHESAHKKYYDCEIHSIEELLNLITSSSLAYFCTKTLKNFKLTNNSLSKKFLGITSFLGSLKLLGIGIDNSSKFRESRADFTAFHALGCHKCVSEYSEFRPTQDSDRGKELRREGYFPKNDLEIISEKFRKENRVCDYHVQQQQNIFQKAWRNLRNIL